MMVFYNLGLVIGSYLFFLYLWLPVFLFFICNQNRFHLKNSTVLALSLGLTVILYACCYYILRVTFFSMDSAVCVIYPIPFILTAVVYVDYKNDRIFSKIKKYFKSFTTKKVLLLVVMIGLFYLILSPYLFRNGFNPDGGLDAYDLFSTEVFHHLTLVNDFKSDIHPKTLHFIQSDRSYYHWGANLFIHFIQVSSSDPNGLILFVYFFVPLMLFILFVSIYAFTMELWGNYWAAFLAAAISLFCYDYSALILWIRGILVDHHMFFGTTFPSNLSTWTPIITSFQLFHNPSYLFSTTLFFTGILLLLKYEETRSTLFFLLAILTWVIMLKAKITAFLVAIAGILAYAFVKAVFKKDYKTLYLALVILIFSLPVMILAAGESRNGIEFAKWFFPNNFSFRAHMISESVYNDVKNIGFPQTAEAVILFTFSVIIYYAGLINIRVFLIFRKWNWIRLKNLIMVPSIHTLLVFMFLAGFAAFVFAVNTMRKHDSMWFYLLIIFFMNIYLAQWMESIFKTRKRYFAILKTFVLILTGFTVLSFILPCVKPATYLHHEYSSQEMEVYHRLQKDPNKKRVMTKYFDLYTPGDEKNMAVQALAGKPVISEGLDYVFAYVEGDSVYKEKVRLVRQDIDEFYATSNKRTATDILNKYDIRYILLKAPDSLHFDYYNTLELLYNEPMVKLYQYQTN